MITPEYLNEVIAGTEGAVNRLNNRLMLKIVEGIVEAFYKGESLLMPSTIQELHRILQSGHTLQELQKIIEDALPSMQAEIKQAFYDSANEIAKYNYEFTRMLVENAKMNVKMPKYTFENIPRSAKDLHMTIAEIMKLENAYRRTMGTVKNMAQSTAIHGQDIFFQACDDAFMDAQAGKNPDRAVADIIDRVAREGCTRVVYPSGHVDKSDVAIARAVRTGINQANSEIILTRASEMGVQYVMVSKHLGARVTKHNDYTNHMWWQGKVYSLDWKKDILIKNMASVPLQDKEFGYLQEIKEKLMKEKKFDFPDFVDTCGYGEIEGIIGINCRHTFQFWNPAVNIDNSEPIPDDENEARFRQEQEQRAMERKIRKLKGEREALKKIPNKDDATKDKIHQLTQKINADVKKLVDFCDKYNLQYYSERLGIGVV